MTSDRDFVYIGPIAVRHATAQRDYLCGTCGSPLATRFIAPVGWCTLCTQDDTHPPAQFVHKNSYAYRQAKEVQASEEAKSVFRHLPEALQAAILDEQGGSLCQ